MQHASQGGYGKFGRDRCRGVGKGMSQVYPLAKVRDFQSVFLVGNYAAVASVASTEYNNYNSASLAWSLASKSRF